VWRCFCPARFRDRREWTALVRRGRKMRIGGGSVQRLKRRSWAAAELGEAPLRFFDGDLDEELERIGHVRCAYIGVRMSRPDRERYQTDSPKRRDRWPPPAGLHFTPEILVSAAGPVRRLPCTLHSGWERSSRSNREVASLHLHAERL